MDTQRIKRTYHSTTFQQSLKRVQPTWGDYFKFSQNEISMVNRKWWDSKEDVKAEVRKAMIDMKKCLLVHKWKGTRQLNLGFQHCPKLKDADLEVINTKFFKDVQRLTLDFEGNERIVSNGLQNLIFRVSKNQRRLNKFTLNIARSKLVSERIAKLGEGVTRYFPLLKQLSFNFINCENLKDEAMGKLGKAAGKNFNRLTRLTVNVSLCEKVGSAGLANFASKLSEKTQQLALMNYQYTNDTSAQEVQLIGAAINKRLPNLRVLDLDFGGNTINSEALLQLTQHLGNQKSLQHLGLSFAACTDFTNQEVEILVSGLHSLADTLLSYSLNLQGCRQLTDAGLRNFERNFSEMQVCRIKHFFLKFARCKQITDEGLNSVRTAIGQHFKQLTNLQLIFEDCNLITDQGFSSLVDDLAQNLTQLQYLALNFGGCQLTDQSLIRVGEVVRNGMQLSELDLCLKNCKELNDDGFTQFIENLTSSSDKLKSITLNFNFCSKITNNVVQGLVNRFEKQAANLNQLTLHFLGCVGVTSVRLIKNLETAVPKFTLFHHIRV